MTIYVGKSIDLFEDVWNMWMRCAGVDAYIHADVLSYRSFAFTCGEDIIECFSPMQPMPMAITELCGNLGIEEKCSIIPASNWDGQFTESEQPVLLADIYMGVENDSIRNHFYQGAPPFSLLYRHNDGKRLIYISPGTPYMEVSKEQVMNRISASKGYVVTGKMPMQIRWTPAEKILQKGIQWRKKVVKSEEWLQRMEERLSQRKPGGSLSLAVQYGLMNYQIQISKVVRFCEQEIGISDYISKQLEDILLQVGQVHNNHICKGIVQIEKDFWTLIGEIGENCLAWSKVR